MNQFSQSLRNVGIPSKIVIILESRVIPEAEILDKDTEMKQAAVDETRMLVASTVLQLTCLNTDIDDPQRSSKSGVDVFGTVSSSFSSGNEIESTVKWSLSTAGAEIERGKAVECLSASTSGLPRRTTT